jgi:hypothetical protein
MVDEIYSGGYLIELDVFVPVIKQLAKNGFVCNENLAAKLWTRYSKDQYATWVAINEESLIRFVEWIESDLDCDMAVRWKTILYK